MSVHVTGGAVGNAIAPMIFAVYAQWFDARWTPLLALPALAALVRLGRHVPDIQLSPHAGGSGFLALRPYAKPLALLWSVVVIRTTVAIGFSVFLPVLMTIRGMSVASSGLRRDRVPASQAASAACSAGWRPIGSAHGASLPARWRSAAPLLVGAMRLPDAASLRGAALGGFFLGSTLPVNIAYAHAIAPVAPGAVSSLMLGVAWGVGGMAVPLVGLAGDAIGIALALQGLALLPLARRAADARAAGGGNSRGGALRGLKG